MDRWIDGLDVDIIAIYKDQCLSYMRWDMADNWSVILLQLCCMFYVLTWSDYIHFCGPVLLALKTLISIRGTLKNIIIYADHNMYVFFVNVWDLCCVAEPYRHHSNQSVILNEPDFLVPPVWCHATDMTSCLPSQTQSGSGLCDQTQRFLFG